MTSEEIASLRQNHYNATLISLRKANSDLAILRVRPDFAVPKHQAGQYGTLGLGKWEPRHPECQTEVTKLGEERKMIRRAYSISCSILGDDGELEDRSNLPWIEFYIVLVRKSDKDPPALTPRLFMLNEGDRLFVGEKIAGHFNLDPVKPTDNVIFLSTGTGEAPHNYMAWDLLRRGHQGKILAACCVRYKADLGYYDIHQTVMRKFPQYKYLSLTTREAVNAGHKVYIQDLITSGQLEEQLGDTLDPAQTHVYLCGNPKMIGVKEKDPTTGQLGYPQPMGVIEILSNRGFQVDQPSIKLKGNIHYEEFW